MQYTLRELELVDTKSDPAFDNMTRLAATLFEAPVSLISIVDHENKRQFFTSQLGVPEPWSEKQQTPLTHSFCQHVVADNAVLVVDNANEHPRVQKNLAIPDLGVVAYLGAPVHNANGHPLGALCVIDKKPRAWTERDVSILKSLAACVTETIKLKSSYLDSEALRAEQTEFNYAISHDLKSPVNTLQLLTTEMAEMWNAGEIEGPDDFLKQAQQTINRMSTLIEDTLDYIQVTMSSDTASTVVSLETTLAIVQEQLADQLSACNGTISTSNLPTLPGDPGLLSILFHQLLSNAIKFHKPDVPLIISVNCESSPVDSFYKIVVTDNGIGIDAEHHNVVFTLFARLHTRDEYDGTGLGLSVCRRILAHYGGRIEIESTLDNGTRVIVLLPRAVLCQAA